MAFPAEKHRLGEDEVEQLLRLSNACGLPDVEFACRITAAKWALDKGDVATAVQSMKLALLLVRDDRVSFVGGRSYPLLSRLLSVALTHEVEEQTARRLMASLQLRSTGRPELPESSPRPISIRVLGTFGIERNGTPIECAAKEQKKPLELLKALVALGGSRVQEHALSDALWPDSEGDAASQVLATTLHRLRKMVGDGAFIHRQGGTLTLRRARCDLDLWRLEALLDSALATSRPEAPSAELAERILASYRPFLGQEEAGWALQPRRRLERQVLRVLRLCADRCRERGDFRHAIPIYEEMLELDDLAEDCYRGLMQCLASDGRAAEATQWYRRCQATLRSTLGMGPSGATRALYAQLQRELVPVVRPGRHL